MALAKHNDMPAQINRRSVLTAAIAAPLTAVPAIAVADTDTPVMRLFREHRRLTNAANAYKPGDMTITDAEMDELFYNRRDAIEAEMMVTTSQTPQDMAAKMIVAHCYGDMTCLDYDGKYWAEARALVGQAA